MALRPAPPGTIVLMSRAWGVFDHCGHGPVAFKHWLLPNGTALVRGYHCGGAVSMRDWRLHDRAGALSGRGPGG
jgi:hypothetical protein